MRVAIMQPTYLPWIGYFALMNEVDEFIFLDSVQFSKRSWQQRNQIKTASGPKWLSVPVISKGKNNQLIRDVEIDSSRKFPQNHIDIITQNYKKSEFFDYYSEYIFEVLRQNHDNLSDLTTKLILVIKNLFDINTKISFSSDFLINGKKDELLSKLCEHVGASEYISPLGSKGYLNGSEFFIKRDISVKYFDYIHPKYNQLNGSFQPYMSAIDLIFNCGVDKLNLTK